MTSAELVSGITAIVGDLDGLLLGTVAVVVALGVAGRIVKWIRGV